jgi:hypothetical protein
VARCGLGRRTTTPETAAAFQEVSLNGPDQTLGNFDTARVQRMIDITTPIFTAQRQPPMEGLKPEDIATNEFVDMSIGIPS